MSNPTQEIAVRFGPRQNLAGIVSTRRDPLPGVPLVVIVNAGVIHRVGPNRLYVDMARSLAAQGYQVLRFDLSGLGDSEPCNEGTSLNESVTADIRAAFAYLEQTRNATRFVMLGLCAGANYSLLVAFEDARIAGGLLIDPTVDRTWRSKLVHGYRRLTHVATLRSLLTMRHPVWQRSIAVMRSGNVALAAEGQTGQLEAIRPMTPGGIRESLQESLDRGLELLFVFTGGVNHAYNYQNQLFDLLPGINFREQVCVQFMPQTDHALVDSPSRDALMLRMHEWFSAKFPAGTFPSLVARAPVAPVTNDADDIVEFELL